MKSKLQVYCDMDQVLAAFHSKLEHIIGKSVTYPLSAEDKTKIREHNKKDPIFKNLDKMPSTDELVKFIEEHFPKHALLTLDDDLVDDQAKQKKEWANKNLEGWKVIIVRDKGVNKAYYANPNSVLIDDSIKNITAWQNAGGIGIWYHNAFDTIKALKNLIN